MEDGKWARTNPFGPSSTSPLRWFQPPRYAKSTTWTPNSSLTIHFFYPTDTAQIYQNEADVGSAIRESGLARSDIYITTKYSGLDGLDIPTSINNSLKNVCSSLTTFCLFYLELLSLAWSIVYRPVPYPQSQTRCSGHTHCVETDGRTQNEGFSPVSASVCLNLSFSLLFLDVQEHRCQQLWYPRP